jgi:Zn-finger nucleic acid-binding protein
MKCPACDELLVMAERQGIEIDYCPKCRGVWLDKGELDKIIERSTAADSSGPAPRQAPPSRDVYTDRDKPYYDDRYRHPYKKKKGFLGDLFDFD